MKKVAPLALTTLFLTSCDAPSSQPQYLEVDAPAWTNDFTVEVGRRSCRITDAEGREFHVVVTDADIADGFSASRWRRFCSIEETETSVTCSWFMYQSQPVVCRINNPAHTGYHAKL